MFRYYGKEWTDATGRMSRLELGIGLTDAHLIASVFINSPTLLWTRDKQLRKVAEAFGVHASLA